VNSSLPMILAMFARAWMLPVAAIACVVVLAIGWRADARRRRRLAQLGDLPVLERLIPNSRSSLAPRVRAAVLGLAILCLGIALAGPQWGTREERRRDTGVDVALVLDVSASMLAKDESPSRLDRMKSDVQRLLATMPSARIALIVVAGRSYVLTPLTADHDAIGMFLEGMDPGMVSQGGTAIGDGLVQATQLLGASQRGADRAVIVMSDGETWDNDGAVAAAALSAKESRLAVVTVAYGTAAGATIPVAGGGVKRDTDGQPVITRASPSTLGAIARVAEGVFIEAKAPDRPGRIRDALRRLRQTERVYSAGESPIQRYEIFLWPAFVLLLFDAIFAERAARRLKTAITSAATVTIALVSTGASVGAQTPTVARGDPVALYREHRYQESAQAFRVRVAQGDRSVRSVFNLATALLQADSIPAATDLLERVVSMSPDAELRFRALFNLGLANLRRARAASPTDAAPYFASAVAAYKRALRTRAEDPDAKWNLELSLREQQRNSGGGGGGNGEPPPQPPPPSKGQQQLDKQRADAVLSSASRDERDVQTRKQRDGQRREAPNGRDW
jgi:Ca-activated chloride channel homolog